MHWILKYYNAYSNKKVALLCDAAVAILCTDSESHQLYIIHCFSLTGVADGT